MGIGSIGLGTFTMYSHLSVDLGDLIAEYSR